MYNTAENAIMFCLCMYVHTNYYTGRTYCIIHGQNILHFLWYYISLNVS